MARLNEYRQKIDGIEHTVQYTEEDAERHGLTEAHRVTAAAAPARTAKAAAPENK